jgi:hypothetical protein
MSNGDAALRAINQIKTRLHTIFGDKIDISDAIGKSDLDRESQYLTRALAALYVKSEIPITISAATKAVTDGYAKRYISGLWEDIKKDPYTAIFNEKVTGRSLWALVRLEKEIERQLLNASATRWGREKLILVHGNRFVAHIVLNRADLSKIGNKGAKTKSKLDEVRKLTSDIAGGLLHILTTDYLESYPGNLFKNQDKQEELKVKLLKLLDEGFQPPQLNFTF